MAKPLAVEVRRERLVGDERFGYALQQELEDGDTLEQVVEQTERLVLAELNRVAPDPRQIAEQQKKEAALTKAQELRRKREEALKSLDEEEAEAAGEFGDIWTPDLLSQVVVVGPVAGPVEGTTEVPATPPPVEIPATE